MKISDPVLHELWESVGAVRDQARVQANLARRELQDDLERLEGLWQTARGHRAQIQNEISAGAQEARASFRRVLEELRDGYRDLTDG